MLCAPKALKHGDLQTKVPWEVSIQAQGVHVLWAVGGHVTVRTTRRGRQPQDHPPKGARVGKLEVNHLSTATQPSWALVSLTPGMLTPHRSGGPCHVVTVCSHCLMSDWAAQCQPHGRDVGGTEAAQVPSGFSSHHTVSKAK